MTGKTQGLISFLLSFLVISGAFTLFFKGDSASALEDRSSNLTHKISKDFTNKYCNAIAFGLSKESAMIFSIEENKKVFEKRKGINNINKELLAEEIAISVVEKCGYLINLYREEGIKDFKNYYQSKD